MPATNGGKDCELGKQVDVCPVDCESSWGAWSECDASTGTRTRSPVITTPCFSNANADGCSAASATPGSLNEGQACPAPETEKCKVDCEVSWSEWSACDAASGGKQTRQPTTVVAPLNGGAVCPTAEVRTCQIECVFSMPDWTTCDRSTGRQSRTPVVTQVALNCAADSALDCECPPEEIRDCPVDCTFSWNSWTPAVCVGGQHTTQDRFDHYDRVLRHQPVSVRPQHGHPGATPRRSRVPRAADAAVPGQGLRLYVGKLVELLG